MGQADPKDDEIIGPAIVTRFHRQDRSLSAAAGTKVGFTNHGEHPLSRALFLEKIDDVEFKAGDLYRALFEKMGRSGRDSTELSVVSGGSGLPFTQTQVDAIHALQAIERRIQQPYDVIVRKFCGEGYTASESVKAAHFRNPRDVWEKTRLALNKLALAISQSGVSRGAICDE